MGQIKPAAPVVLLLAATSRYPEALDWARQRAEDAWGPLQLQSKPFVFDQTQYYRPSMGADLQKQFFAFRELIDPGRMADLKIETNDWEVAYQRKTERPESRPLNLDPGYVSEAKLVLASTKDHAHRIYLHAGIYAEVTLHYRAGGWQSQSWTFPDFKAAHYFPFLDECRQFLRRRLGKIS